MTHDTSSSPRATVSVRRHAALMSTNTVARARCYSARKFATSVVNALAC